MGRVRRERFHATWVVEVQDGPRGDAQLQPVAPGKMRDVIHLTAERLLDMADQDIVAGVRVGAVTVASMPDGQWQLRPLAMIPLPSGGTGRGEGPEP